MLLQQKTGTTRRHRGTILEFAMAESASGDLKLNGLVSAGASHVGAGSVFAVSDGFRCEHDVSCIITDDAGSELQTSPMRCMSTAARSTRVQK